MSNPYWRSRVEFMEVIAMARDGRIHAETTEFPLREAVDAYSKLKAGQITGRAVLKPDGVQRFEGPRAAANTFGQTGRRSSMSVGSLLGSTAE